MAFCPAATATAAIFTALIVLDIVNKSYNDILLHVSGGVFSVLGIFVICNALGNTAGWGFLAVPFIVLLIGFLLIWIDGRKDPVQPAPKEMPCQVCGYMPCQCMFASACSQQNPYSTSIPSVPARVPETPLPPAVTKIPQRKVESDFSCPPKRT